MERSTDTPERERPLEGRVAVVTGASRRRGIGFAVARHLAALGADLFLTHWRPHDEQQPWGADDLDPLLAELAELTSVAHLGVDLADPDAPERVLDAAIDRFGHVDVLVANHARSGGDGDLFSVDAAMLDGHWAVDARSVLLLTREFARRFDPNRGAVTDRGRVIWMTSGQGLGPMRDEVAYATAKAALAGITPTIAAELIGRGIVLNTVNPGPVDTGYLSDGTTDRDPAIVAEVSAAFPRGEVGRPDDPARLIAWLATDAGRWMVGQVLHTEGGFDRFRW